MSLKRKLTIIFATIGMLMLAACTAQQAQPTNPKSTASVWVSCSATPDTSPQEVQLVEDVVYDSLPACDGTIYLQLKSIRPASPETSYAVAIFNIDPLLSASAVGTLTKIGDQQGNVFAGEPNKEYKIVLQAGW